MQSSQRTTRRQKKRAEKALPLTASLPQESVIRSLIRREIARSEEKKTIELTTNAFYLANAVNTTGFAANNVWELTNSPGGSGVQITQGTGASNRIGNQVTITKALLKMVLLPYNYVATYNTVPQPQDVRIIIFRLKGIDKSLAAAQSVFSTTGSCFQSNNTSAGLGGDIVDMVRTINKDVVQVMSDQIVKVGAQIYNDGASGGIGPTFWGSNNDYSYNQLLRFDLLRLGLTRKWQFNDTSNTPYGYEPLYCVIDPVSATGAAHSNTTNGRSLLATYQLEIEFTDA